MAKKKIVNVTFNFEIDSRPNRLGLFEIFFRVQSSRTEKQRIKTEVYCKNDHFGVFKNVVVKKLNPETGKKEDKIVLKRVLTFGSWITKGDKEHIYKNEQLKKKYDEYKKTYDKKKEDDKYTDKDEVILAVNNNYLKKDVVSVFDLHIRALEIKKDYPNYKGYKTTRNHFINYLASIKQESVDFRNIGNEWLLHFQNYLFKAINGDKPASESSVWTNLKRLRKICNLAIKKQIVTPDVYPFRDFEIKEPQKKSKQRLVVNAKTGVNEVALFKSANLKKGTPHYDAQNMFMLATRMAGTRVEDMLRMQIHHISNGRISFNMNKGTTGGTRMSFLIDEEMQKILNNYIEFYSKPEHFLFPFLDSNNRGKPFLKLEYDEQKKEINNKTAYVNKLLKEIGNEVGIKKKITTHMSRHTFASVAMKQTKDLAGLQAAFAHSDPKITQGYLDDLDEEVLDDMMQTVTI